MIGRVRAGLGGLVRRAPAGDDGSALIEFVGASVILLVPLVYLLVAVFTVQRGSFAAAEAAREAGRAFATAPSTDVGRARAAYAAQVSFADQGVAGAPVLRFTAAGAGCGAGAADVEPTLRPGATFTVCVSRDLGLPLVDRGPFAHAVPAHIQVVGRYAVAVDRFRAAA